MLREVSLGETRTDHDLLGHGQGCPPHRERVSAGEHEASGTWTYCEIQQSLRCQGVEIGRLNFRPVATEICKAQTISHD